MTPLVLPCTLMRAGTSRGPFFLREWLPEDPQLLEQALIGAIGASDPLQLDGLGGGSTLNSKVAIVSRSREPGCDLDYLFAQVGVGHRSVDMRPNCGNMLSGVVPFAIERGLIQPQADRTTVRVFNVNTRAKIDVTVCTPQGRLTYEGDTRIDGVAGTAAPVLLSFLDCWGAVTGKLFPTGRRIDAIEGIELTCIDAAMPLMMAKADALGVSGRERPDELDANGALLETLERLRRIAGERMGLGDVANSVVPKPVLVSEGDDPHSVMSRYFTPHRCHSSHAVTGAIGVAAAFALPGTVASGMARGAGNHTLAVLHPEGRIEVAVDLAGPAGEPVIERAALVRTARRIFEGELTLPAYVFPQVRSERPMSAQPEEFRIIVPTSAGGANDAIARVVARGLSADGSRRVRVDNRAGANGTIACHYVRQAVPDGRTLLLGYTATHAIHPVLEDVGYDPIAGFTPLGTICSSATVLVVPAQTGAASFEELRGDRAAGRRSLRYAAAGRGTLSHLSAEVLGRHTGLHLEGSFFNGAGPALAEVVSGRAHLMFASLYAALPHLQSGRLRALAVAGSSSLAATKDVPSLSDLGLPMLERAQWYALFAPPAMAAAQVDTLQRDLDRVLSSTATVEHLRASGASLLRGTPEDLRTLLIEERARWQAIVRDLRLGELVELSE